MQLFMGEPPEEPSEQALISRLRSDLESRGVPATLYANFYPSARRSRQVDLLVRTDRRTAHVEVKGFRPDWPVRARPNGLWVQVRPDGTERSLETNCGRQALGGTYAISNAMRGLVRRGAVSALEDPFYCHIDTIVGMWEIIPPGSDIEALQYVTVLGYDDLLQRLTTPGPVVPWTDADWNEFARSLHLFQPEAESESERHRRSSLEIITDYHLQARSILAAGLSSLVDVGAIDEHEIEASATDISRRVADGGVVAVVGPSGSGKSFLAQHLAVGHCDNGRLVVWLRADEYEKGRFSGLLARAMAPCSGEQWTALVRGAKEFGVAITVVIDGLNECPDEERSRLLQQLGAFTLRYPAGVLITSTTADGLPDVVGAAVLRVGEPDEHARLAILASYGARHPERISDQFRTPFELAIAAECERELDENASVAELLAAYIRHFAASEQLRAGLRSLASRLHSKLRTSLTLLEANSILNSPSRDLTARQVDEVLACPLLTFDRHRVRFRHDLIGQFLAAEDVVRSATSGENLGALLGAPANAALAEIALGIESNHHRVWEALRALANPKLIFSALTAGYGSDVAEMAAQEIRDVLHSAIASTATETATVESADGFFGHWVTERQWTERERALLFSAGRGLAGGMFVDEVCELIDRTDEVCLNQAQRLKAAGGLTPVSLVVAATYIWTPPTDGHGLAASYVSTAFEMAAKRTRFTSDWRGGGLARHFAADASARSWGRFYLALLSVHPDDIFDQALFASLYRRAWNARGYHLQLQALEAAEFFGGSDEPHRSQILDAVQALDPDHPALCGSRLEVLARFGEIETPTTADELRVGIRETISHPDDIACCQIASGIVSSQFEDEAIFGPYFAAINGLTRQEKAWLFTMAVRGSDLSSSLHLCWILDQLTDLVPTGDTALDNAAKSVFATFLGGPVEDAMMPTKAAGACLTAVRGWAKFEATLPPEAADPTPERRNWRLLANLLLVYEHDDVVVDADEIWCALLLDRQETIVTLASIEGVTTQSSQESRQYALGRLIQDYPGPLRQLFEWALENLAEVSAGRLPPGTNAAGFVMGMLGEVGDEPTAARLQIHTHDPEAGRYAVAAIRQIHRRIAP